jgi:hypothetical protein
MPAKRAGDAPGQVLHRHGEGEGLARPAAVHRDRLQPQPEAMADAHAEGDDAAPHTSTCTIDSGAAGAWLGVEVDVSSAGMPAL